MLVRFAISTELNLTECGRGTTDNFDVRDHVETRESGFPWMAILMRADTRTKKEQICPGVIISTTTILAAAVCIGG